MDWTQQSNDLMKAWTDAQKQLWSGWMGMMPGMAGTGSAMPGLDPSQWMRSMVDTWSSAQTGTPGRVAGNIFGAPDMMSQSVNLLLKAWQSVAPQIGSGQPWKGDLQGLIGQWTQEMSSLPGRQAATANEFTELTKVLFEQWSPMTGPWLAMVGQATASGHPGEAFMGGTSGLSKLMGLEQAMLPSLSGVSQMPRGTVAREKMGKILAAVDAMGDLRKSQAEFQKAMSEAMGTAVERTIEHMAKLAEKGESIDTVRDLMRTWFTIADKTLNEAFTKPEFLATQDKMTNDLMTYKVKQRDALELIYDAMDLPTRSALDEAYKDIAHLKREVRKLKKQLDGGSSGEDAQTRKAPAKKTRKEDAPS